MDILLCITNGISFMLGIALGVFIVVRGMMQTNNDKISKHVLQFKKDHVFENGRVNTATDVGIHRVINILCEKMTITLIKLDTSESGYDYITVVVKCSKSKFREFVGEIIDQYGKLIHCIKY